METKKLTLIAMVFAVCLGPAVCLSSGPPPEESTCLNMRPESRSPHKLQPGNGTYDLTVEFLGDASSNGYFSYMASTSYTGECQLIPYLYNLTSS